MKNILCGILVSLMLVSPMIVSSMEVSPATIVCNTTADCPQGVDCGAEGKSLECVDKGLPFRYCACVSNDDPSICKQQQTLARYPNTGECRAFENTCGVPEGWVIVENCVDPIPCPTDLILNIPKGCTILPPCQVYCPENNTGKINLIGIAVVLVLILIVMFILKSKG